MSDVWPPTRPSFRQTMTVVQLMSEDLVGVDAEFDRLMATPLRRWWTRTIYLPLYFHLFNEGWILSRGAHIVAYLYLRYARHTCHVNDLGVVAGMRRQGFGRRLMRFAEERARARGLETMTLAVTVRNERAVNLYQALGYVAAPHHRWRGRPLMPPRRRFSTLRLRELLPEQRQAPFLHFARCSFSAVGLPVDVLLADHVAHWWAPRATSFEVWGDEAPIAYADLMAHEPSSHLRLFPLHPERSEELIGVISALLSVIRTEILEIELGSEIADQAAGPFLRGLGFEYRANDRMLMVKSLQS